ncbi:MAG: HD domain-containing protein [Candidatus Tectomicrobia bacterium]|uniref:HD domain-containing protein n=1 Tax=Tectimicrobiota bacterium TaxID=2528274 RepID=A0A932CN95_UNCTE|nr:HD domain-containing protein [Candidatus Tectomicrobia bacterium]
MTNVFVFTLKVGRGLKYEGHQLEELGLAALLHDIGYGRIPPEIRQACRPLTPEEMHEIQAHPAYGHEILLTSLGEAHKQLAEIVLQTHERENGQGYPHGLKGREIHEYAKIIGISDVFEALTHSRPHRKRLLPYEAVKEILSSQRHLFPSNIFKILIQEMSVFPIYSYVRLNSGAIGRVIATEANQPLRPTVEILCDSEGKRVEGGKIIRLVETSLLHITGLVDEKEIAEG